MGGVFLAIVRRETLFALFMAMELSWIVAVLFAAERLLGLEMVMPLGWATWLYPASFLYVKAEQRLNLQRLWPVVLRTVVGCLVLIGTIRGLLGPLSPSGQYVQLLLAGPLLAVIAAAAFAMLRGWVLGGRQIDTKGFVEGFQIGFLVLLLVVFLQAAAPHDPNTFHAVISFLGLGLFGLWLARWLDSGISARRLDQAGWPLLACAVIAIVLMAGMGIGAVLDHHGILFILTPVLWLWELVIAFVQFLVNLLPESEPIELLSGPQMAPRPQAGPNMVDFFGDWVRPIARFMFYVSSFAMIGAALFRNIEGLLRWLNRRRTNADGIVFERSAFGLMDDLKDILAAFTNLFLRLWRRVLKLLGSRGRPLPRAEREVRDIYARLTRWAAGHDCPRAPNQTPYDFLPVLKRFVPEAEAELTHLTECYVAVRYGTARADPSLIRGLKEGWRRIRSKQRKSYRMKKRKTQK